MNLNNRFKDYLTDGSFFDYLDAEMFGSPAVPLLFFGNHGAKEESPMLENVADVAEDRIARRTVRADDDVVGAAACGEDLSGEGDACPEGGQDGIAVRPDDWQIFWKSRLFRNFSAKMSSRSKPFLHDGKLFRRDADGLQQFVRPFMFASHGAHCG